MTNTPNGTGVTPVDVVFDDGPDDSWPQELGLFASDEERAFAKQLVLEHVAELAEQDALAEANGWGPLEGCEVDPLTDDELVLGLSAPVHETDLLLLASLHPDDLSKLARLACVAGLDRIEAFVAATRAQMLVGLAGEEPSGDYLAEVAAEHEVAIARRSSRYAAGRDIDVARSLKTTFPGFGHALLAGEVSEGHCRTLVERTRFVTDPDVLTAIEARVLRKAKRLPVGKFGDEVLKAVADLDPDTLARHRRAKQTSKCVYSRPLPDGLGFMGVVDEWATISAMQATIDADAQALRKERGGAAAVPADDDARMGACRADAIAARVLGSVDSDGTVTWEPRESVQVTVEVVIDLDTLRGEQDRMALVDGEPVPAEIGREWADVARYWRRVVTDPVDGHLLDYGTRQYLPDRLRRFVFARDGGCIAPDCSTRSWRRRQLDHVDEFPHGPSSAANTDCKCVVTHQLKTAGYVTISDSNADGSRTWTTAAGQTVKIPPRPYLHDPSDDPPPPRPTQSSAPEPPPPPHPDTPHPADQDDIPPF